MSRCWEESKFVQTAMNIQPSASLFSDAEAAETILVVNSSMES